MIRSTLAVLTGGALLALAPLSARAQSSGLPWSSGTVLTATQMQSLDSSKVNVTSGTSTNQTLTTPTITGGTATSTDISAALATAFGASYARTPAERSGTSLQPQDFLDADQTPAQLLSGEIDAEPSIAKAIAAGSAVTLPCGTYRIDEPFPTWSTDGIRLSGKSMSCVTLNINFAISDGSINVFTLSGHGQSISNLTLNANKQMTAGTAVFMSLTSNDRLHDLLFSGPFWNGIYVYGSNNTHIDHVYGRPPYLASATVPDPQDGEAYAGGSFITLAGDVSTGGINIDTYMNDINIAQYTYGISYVYTSGVYGNAIDVVGALNAHLFTPASGGNVNGIQLSNVLGDTSYGPNWYFPDSGGGVYELMCSGCWASSSYSDAGIVMGNPKLSQVNFSNSTALNNSKSGLYISAGENIRWVGGAIEMNNTKLGSTSDEPDVYVSDGSGTTDWLSFTGAFIGQGGIMKYNVGKSNEATYAIDMSAVPDTTHISIVGVQTYNHSSGQFNLPTTTTNIIQSGNQGS